MVVQAIMIHCLGQGLKATPEREARVMAMRAEETISDWLLLKQSLVVLTIVMVASCWRGRCISSPRPSPWAAPRC